MGGQRITRERNFFLVFLKTKRFKTINHIMNNVLKSLVRNGFIYLKQTLLPMLLSPSAGNVIQSSINARDHILAVLQSVLNRQARKCIFQYENQAMFVVKTTGFFINNVKICFYGGLLYIPFHIFAHKHFLDRWFSKTTRT